jgi:hypothetical protein
MQVLSVFSVYRPNFTPLFEHIYQRGPEPAREEVRSKKLEVAVSAGTDDSEWGSAPQAPLCTCMFAAGVTVTEQLLTPNSLFSLLPSPFSHLPSPFSLPGLQV